MYCHIKVAVSFSNVLQLTTALLLRVKTLRQDSNLCHVLDGKQRSDSWVALTRCSRSGCAWLRYERGQRVAYGGALVQRHVALPQDLANKEGKGLLVRAAPPICS